MLPSSVRIEEYLDGQGGSPFAVWFDGLDPIAAAKVTVALSRIERGAISNVKGVGCLHFLCAFHPHWVAAIQIGAASIEAF